MNEFQRVKIISKILNKTYPKIKVPLKSRNIYTLLISVLLSAQCNRKTNEEYLSKYYKPVIYKIRKKKKKIN